MSADKPYEHTSTAAYVPPPKDRGAMIRNFELDAVIEKLERPRWSPARLFFDVGLVLFTLAATTLISSQGTDELGGVALGFIVGGFVGGVLCMMFAGILRGRDAQDVSGALSTVREFRSRSEEAADSAYAIEWRELFRHLGVTHPDPITAAMIEGNRSEPGEPGEPGRDDQDG